MINRVLSWTQPVGKLVQQSFGEVQRVKLSKPNPNPIQSVIDRRNLRTQNVFWWRKEKRPVHKKLLVNVCTKNLTLQIEQGNLWSENIRVMHAHDGTGEPVKSSASTHTVEEFVPAEHRDTASSSTLQPTRRISISTSQECRIRQWNDHMASTFET